MTRDSRPSFSVRGARKAYGDRVALDGVDLEARPGEWVALLGPNGAGKTTLMRALAGRVALDAGTIEIGGSVVERSPRAALLRRVGVVPQSIALYGALTVRENLETFASLHGVTREARAARVERALEWTGLADRAAAPVATLSGGMQRRLNVACGVLHRPGIVLLDEPTVGVDARSRARIGEMLLELRRDGATLLHGSHELREIERAADRVVILHRGRVVADGSAAEVVAAHAASDRRVRVVVDGPVDPTGAPERFEIRDGEVRGTTDDVARDLGALLGHLRRSGVRVRDVHVERPGLEDVLASLGERGAMP